MSAGDPYPGFSTFQTSLGPYEKIVGPLCSKRDLFACIIFAGCWTRHVSGLPAGERVTYAQVLSEARQLIKFLDKEPE